MNILPHKSWHVYNRKNIERVRRDEAQAKEEEAVKKAQANKAENEARLRLLRKRAASRNDKTSQVDTTSQTNHINLFEDIESQAPNEERAQEEKAKNERRERQMTMYLDKDATDDATPWYAQNQRQTHATRKRLLPAGKGDDRKRKRSSLPTLDDPLDIIRTHVDKKDKKGKKQRVTSHHSSNTKTNSTSSTKSNSNSNKESSSSIEALRAKRLEREQAERRRTRQVVYGEVDSAPQLNESHRYHSQFNPTDTAKAKTKQYHPKRRR